MNGLIALDIGGTSIKAGIVDEHGELLAPTIMHHPSLAHESSDTLFSHLAHIIMSQLKRIPYSIRLSGIGMAFPGPFDYGKGISLMQGINKYDSLYGLNISEELLARLHTHELFKELVTSDFHIQYANDASLYALGETVMKPHIMSGRVLCLCLGTGLGSAFLEDGKLITDGPLVPSNGWVYDRPFLESIIDDYISARGVIQLHYELHKQVVDSVKLLAEVANTNDPLALETFKVFGTRFAEAIMPFINDFGPHTLVLGGQISKSFSLFGPSFIETLQEISPKLQIELSLNSSLSTLVGVSRLF